MPPMPTGKMTFNGRLRLFAKVVAATADKLLLKLADPTMGTTNCPTPSAGLQLVITALHVSCSADIVLQLFNAAAATAPVYEIDVPGGCGTLTIPGGGIAFGEGKEIYLSFDGTKTVKLHAFAEMRPIEFAPAGAY
jgi:hypothetical protein